MTALGLRQSKLSGQLVRLSAGGFPNGRFLFSIWPLGGVAQLGERLVRNQKVVSSILITSTSKYDACHGDYI